MLTYFLFKTQGMLLSATRKGQPDPDLQPIQSPEHVLVSREGQPDGDLHAIQNPENALVSYKQGMPTGW